jgi:D-3-phosphoglycerate dehydrogenase
VQLVSKQELFTKSDFLSIHLVLSNRTRQLVGADELALMKSEAFLINTSRGPIVDEGALLEKLKEKKINGAGIDVYGVEPLPVESEFRKLENIILTPHTGYFTEKSYQVFHDQMVENILAWHSGETIRQLT